jgi:hypothetical protein
MQDFLKSYIVEFSKKSIGQKTFESYLYWYLE